jgi:hypothetical protein
VYVSVKLLYREGVLVKGERPIPGQIFMDRIRNVPVLLLRPVGWVHHESTPSEPLAVLWHPSVAAVGYDSMCFRGMEVTPHAPGRRWTLQKWLCEVLDPARARERLKRASS